MRRAPRTSRRRIIETVAAQCCPLPRSGRAGDGRPSASPRPAPPAPVAQFALQHLADGAARQGVDDLQVGQALGLADPAVDPGLRASSASTAASGLQHDEGHRRLAPARPTARRPRRPPPPSSWLHQHGLEIARIDVEAAGDDHVLLAVHQRQEAVLVEAADVAGADEAFARRRRPVGLGGLGRLVVVADHHRAASGRRPRRSRPAATSLAVLVDQPDVVAGRRAGRPCAACPGCSWRQQHAGAAALGHAVVLDQPAGPALQDVGLQRRGERRGGARTSSRSDDRS